MKNMRLLKALALGAMIQTPTFALDDQPTAELQALDDALPGSLINDPTRLDWQIFGTGQTSKPVKGEDIPGGKAALQITVPKAGATLFEVGANAPITTSIKTGTDIVVAFYARTVSADTADGNGRIGVRVQQNIAPYSGFGDTTLIIEKEWKLYEVAAKATVSIPRGQAVVGFQLAGAKQVVEIGQTIVVAGATSLTAKSSKTVQSATTDLLPQLQGKGRLINNPSNKDWPVFGAGVTHMAIPSPNIPGTGGTALRVTTSAPAPQPYDIGAAIPILEEIKEDDILLIGILARTAPGGTGDGTSKLGIRVQLNEAPYSGFGDNVLTLSPNWKLLQLKTQASTTIAAGKGAVALHFGAAAQAIEVGQVYVLNTSGPIAVTNE
jgi:hypothetical protein